MDNTKVSKTALPVKSIFAVMLAGAFVAFLNQTVINVALPQIMDYFKISAVTANWLSTIFMLTNGIVIPITAFFNGTIYN